MYMWPIPTIELMPLSQLEEDRPVALIMSGPAWRAVSPGLALPIAWQGEALEATKSQWDSLAGSLQGEVIYAVGGGLAADAAKYCARRRELPLICVPTALSVDAFFTWASGVRRHGCVHYLETKPPDLVVVDLDLLAAAPPTIRAAGICDVLSIATGLWDWRFAEDRAQNPPGMEYLPHVAQVAQGILQGALDCAEAAGRGDRQGLKQLLDCLALEVQLCNLIGHSRPEEGSEHYFAYAVENEMGEGVSHGELVGPGILLAAEAQGQESEPLRLALEASGVPLDRIPPTLIQKAMGSLPAYVRQHQLPYGIAHELSGWKPARSGRS